MDPALSDLFLNDLLLNDLLLHDSFLNGPFPRPTGHSAPFVCPQVRTATAQAAQTQIPREHLAEAMTWDRGETQ